MQRNTDPTKNQQADPSGSKWTRSDQGRESEKIFGESGWKPRSAKQAGRAGSDLEREPKAAPARTSRGTLEASTPPERSTKKAGKTESGAATSDRRLGSATKSSQGSGSKRKPVEATKSKTKSATKPRGSVAK